MDPSVGIIGLGRGALSVICVHGENGFNVVKGVLRISPSSVCLN